MADTLVITLPELAERERPATHWWRAVDGAIVASGADAAWRSQLGLPGSARPRLIGLAPVAATRLAFAEPDSGTATPRQAATVARVAAVERSLGERSTLHVVSAVAPLGSDTRIATAVVANSAMLEWLDWASAQSAELDHIVPAAVLMPLGEQWLAATIGSEHVIGRRGLVLPDEPALTEALIGGEEVEQFAGEALLAAIAALCEQPLPLDLRSGRFARRRRLVIDRDRIIELIALAATIPLVIALWSIVSIVRLDQSSDRLDAQTLSVAQAAVGRPLTLETAEAALAEQAARAGSTSGLAVPLTALYQQLQTSASVSSTQIGYHGDGTLAVTLAAPRVDDINPLLVALQRDRYRITAVPRQAADGRAMVDVTVRSGP